MSRTIIALLLPVLLFACSTGSEAGPNPIRLGVAHESAVRTKGWLNPKTLQVQPVTQAPETGDMTIHGAIIGWAFDPSGDIEGALHPVPEGVSTEPAWLRLTDRSIHRRVEGASPPAPPYLTGRFDAENGLFYPSESRVTVSDGS